MKFNSFSDFLNPSKGKYLIVPEGFGGNNCPIKTTMVKEGFEFFTQAGKENLRVLNTYEKYLYFTSMIFRNYWRSKINSDETTGEIPYVFFHLSSTSETSLIKKMLGMSKRNVLDMVKFFVKYGFLELLEDCVSFINWKSTTGAKVTSARRYTVSRHFDRRVSKYWVKDKKIIERINNLIKKTSEINKNDINSVILRDENITSLSFPEEEHLTGIARDLIARHTVDKKGRVMIWKKIDSEDNVVSLSDHITNYLIVLYNDKTIKDNMISGTDYSNRVFYFINNLPKWIRNEIMIRNEKAVEVDIVAFHNRIINKKYSEFSGNKPIDILSYDSHTKISETLSITRDEAKGIGLRYFNSKIIDGKTISNKENKELLEKLDSYFLENNPDFLNYLFYIKCDKDSIRKDRERHTNISVLLIDTEVRIMTEIIKRLDFPVMYIFDCLSVPESEVDETKRVMCQVLEETLGC